LESLDTYLFFSSNNIIESPTAGFQILSFAVKRRLIQLLPHATSHAVLGPWLAAVP